MGVTRVYPRVGGATGNCRRANGGDKGLPPRGRGNLGPRDADILHDRSTPAWAGQPHTLQDRGGLGRVYPRVGGATCTLMFFSQDIFGLPPRGRGNLFTSYIISIPYRSTPAWAGQPTCPPPGTCRSRVYPRVGGATHNHGGIGHAVSGLPPRGRGNP